MLTRSGIDRAAHASVVAAVLIPSTLQIQTTLPLSVTGIRTSVSDLVTPILFVWLIFQVRRDNLSQIRPPWVILVVLLALSGWLFFSTARGLYSFGPWNSWIALNRGAGWLLLMIYMASGWMLIRLGGYSAVRVALRAFLATFWFSVFFSFIIFLAIHGHWWGADSVPEASAAPWQATLGLVTGGSRFQGLVVNPSAFALIAAIALLIHIRYLNDSSLFPPGLNSIGLALSIAALILSFSRSAWIGAAAGVLVLLARDRFNYRRIFYIGALVAAGTSAFIFFSGQFSWISTLQEAAPGTEPFIALMRSLDHRLVIMQNAVNLWLVSPIAGSGIGAFVASQNLASENSVATIHTSYLWLLAETGLIGFVLCATFFIVCIVLLLRSAHAGTGLSSITVGIVTVFMVACLTMDALYQRPLWFFLGIGLAAANFEELAGLRKFRNIDSLSKS